MIPDENAEWPLSPVIINLSHGVMTGYRQAGFSSLWEVFEVGQVLVSARGLFVDFQVP